MKREEMTHFCVPTLTPSISLKHPIGLKQQLVLYYKVKALYNTQLKFQEKIPRIVIKYWGHFFPIFARAPCRSIISPFIRKVQNVEKFRPNYHRWEKQKQHKY